MKETVYRRCGCRDSATGKQLGAKCPQLSTRRHGTYAIRLELPPRKDGDRRSFSRSGYANQDDAVTDRDRVRALLAIPDKDDSEGLGKIADLLDGLDRKAPLPDYDETKRRFRTGHVLASKMTVGEWLDQWYASRRKPRKTTMRSYKGHIEVHLKPAIGEIRLDRLNKAAIAEMFAAMDERNTETLESNALRRETADRLAATRPRAERAAIRAELVALPPFRRATGPSTQQRIRATLRKALNDAIRGDLITSNPAKWVELDPADRPRPLVWTDERVAKWRETGDKPCPVMVWTPVQAGAYLDHLAGDRLYAMWHLFVYRGLRRGEACGVRRDDLSVQSKTLTISEQLVQLGAEVETSAPKSRAGNRIIALDADTLKVLKAHRKKQIAEQLEWGPAWQGSSRIFTREDGSQLVPDWVTDQHERHQTEAGLPPVRLHDLRHTAASLMLAAKIDIKIVQETLGHSSSVLTRDTYTSIFPEVGLEAAEATARVVPRKKGGNRVRSV